MLWKFTHVVAWISSFFIFLPAYFHGMNLSDQFIHSSVSGNLVVFRFLTIINKAARNKSLCKHVFSFFLGIYLGIRHRGSVCLTLKKKKPIFQSDYTILHSYHQFQSVYILISALYHVLFPHLCRHVVLSHLGFNLNFPLWLMLLSIVLYSYWKQEILFVSRT